MADSTRRRSPKGTGKAQLNLQLLQQKFILKLNLRLTIDKKDLLQETLRLFDKVRHQFHGRSHAEVTATVRRILGRVLAARKVGRAAPIQIKLVTPATPSPELPHKIQDEIMPLFEGSDPADDSLGNLFDDLRSDLRNIVPHSNADKAVEIVRSFLEKHEGSRSTEKEVVLETFDGFVDRIDGDTAFVTLQSRANGDVEEGTYSASELAVMGIHEQSSFIFKTVKVGDAIRPVFEPVPQEPVADEVVREIDSKIDQALPEAPPPEAKICEEFQGFVEKIEGDSAYVRLDSQRGERLCGPYPAGELTAAGIGEHDRFLLKAVEVNRAIRFDAMLIPRKRISRERQRQIREEIEAGLEGFTPDDER